MTHETKPEPLTIVAYKGFNADWIHRAMSVPPVFFFGAAVGLVLDICFSAVVLDDDYEGKK